MSKISYKDAGVNIDAGNDAVDRIKENVKSKPLIIFGFVISLTSIFLLLFTINNKFGWYMSN